MSGDKPASSISVKSARNQRRLELRKLNNSVWDEGQPVLIPSSRSLDTSLKKNTAFIRRCRVNLKDKDTLIKEVETLSLEKYLSEIIPALVEGFTKCKTTTELFLGVEVASALHQRFGSELFTGKFVSIFLSGIVFPKKSSLAELTEDQKEELYRETTARHKVILRSIIELWLVGIYRSTDEIASLIQDIPAFAKRSKDGITAAPPLAALHEILANDAHPFHGREIPISVIKSYGSILLEENDDHLITPTLRQYFEMEFDWYITQIERKLELACAKIITDFKSNERSFMTHGQVNESKAETLEKMRKKFLQLLESYKTLCELVSKEPKEYDISYTENDSVAIRIAAATHEDSIWEDEEQRKFYEMIPDYSYKNGQQADTDLSVDKSEEIGEMNEKKLAEELAELAISTENSERSESPSEIADSVQENDDYDEIDDGYDKEYEKENDKGTEVKEIRKGPVEELLERLCSRPSKDAVDGIALEYLQYDNKSSREVVATMLTKNLKIRNTVQLPFVARFLAIINTFAPSVVESVLEYLGSFFSYLQKKRNIPQLLSSRIFVLVYVAELTKFGLTSKYYIGKFFIRMASALVESNSEGLSLLLESCGRYLSRKSKTALFMSEFLERLQKQMKKQFLDVEHRVQLENAITYTLPLEKYEAEEKQRSLIELFIRHLIYYELSSESAQEVLVLLRKLDWNDPDTFKALRKVFTKIHKVNYSNLELMTWLLHALSVSYSPFAVIVIDAVLEDVRKQLEINNFRYNQRRVTEMKYLGFLFLYDLIDSNVIFHTLDLMVTFGHANGRPQVEYNKWDPPDDFLRIKLVCALLDTPGVTEKLNAKSNSRDELEQFTRLFAYYLFTKQNLSMDVEFAVTDTLRKINPNLRLPSDISEALAQLEKSLKNGETDGQDENSEEKSGKTTSRKHSNDVITFKRGRYGIKIEDEKEKVSEHLSVEEQLELLEAERRRKESLLKARQAIEDSKADEEFEEEFQKLMLDRVDNVPSATKQPVFDAPVPDLKSTSSIDDAKIGQAPQMKFQLMTKKTGSSEFEIRPVELPTDFRKAAKIQNERQKRVEEQTKVRKFVLDYMQKDHSDDALGGTVQKVSQPQVLSTRYTKRKEQGSSRGIPSMPDIPPELQS